jgi:hypothetical protein
MGSKRNGSGGGGESPARVSRTCKRYTPEERRGAVESELREDAAAASDARVSRENRSRFSEDTGWTSLGSFASITSTGIWKWMS